MKKIIALLLALTMVFALCACGSKTEAPAAQAPAAEAPAAEAPAAPAADPVVLRVAVSEAPGGLLAEALEGTKAAIEERTEGRVIIEPHYSNELGSIADCIEQISLGANIISETSASSWAPYGCDDMTAMDAMFAFASTEEIYRFGESEMWANMVNELEANGKIHMICMNWAAAPRVVLSTKPINSVADLKGMLVRVPTNTYAAWFNALGASPVSGIPFAEVYSNIETGVIEAAEAPFATLYDYSIYEVAKYAYCSNHTYATGCAGTSVDIWNLLSEEDQKIVTEEFVKGGEVYTALAAASNEDYMKKFEEAGVTIVVPSAEDVEAMQAAASQAAIDLGLREGVMDEIKAASAA